MRYRGTLGVLCWQLVDLVLGQNQTNSTSTSLPVVDLGYELYQATTFNETGGFYSFSNVRYGAPPTGDLRFRAPEPPSTNRTSVQTGEMGRICPQGLPNWILEGLAFVTNYTAGLPFDPSAFPPGINFDDLPPDPRTTEDCLFLDLIVHQNVLKSAGTCGPKAPVLVWIHGGGYAEGYKDMEGTPGKILAEDEDTIFVAINYRLGAFGFISGPTLQEDGVANAGLLDQRLALEWVQKHIHKFGGDPERVTVMGESAGGGSILLQITAHGGQGPPAPFKSAIIQSPALFPFRPASYQENATQNFLALLNVSTIAEARTLPSAALIQANQVQTGASPYGEFVYGPEVDGTFVPEYIGKLLGSGQFDHSVEVIVAHNSDEGPLFTDPRIVDDDSFNAFVATLFPSNNKTLIDYVTNVLYPPIFDGSQLYSSNLERVVLLNSDILVGCNAFYLDTAFLNRTYAYLFAVPPGTHGSDLPYTFYNGPFDSSYNTEAFNVTVASVLQDYILNFAKYGNPSTRVEGVGSFMRYGESAQVMELGTEGISMVTDPAANERCRWWQLGLDWHY